MSETGEEIAWRSNKLELLSKVHTLGGIMDLTFEVVESRYAVGLFRDDARIQILIYLAGLGIRIGMRRVQMEMGNRVHRL